MTFDTLDKAMKLEKEIKELKESIKKMEKQKADCGSSFSITYGYKIDIPQDITGIVENFILNLLKHHLNDKLKKFKEL